MLCISPSNYCSKHGLAYCVENQASSDPTQAYAGEPDYSLASGDENLATSYTLWILQLLYIVRRTSEWLNR